MNYTIPLPLKKDIYSFSTAKINCCFPSGGGGSVGLSRSLKALFLDKKYFESMFIDFDFYFQVKNVVDFWYQLNTTRFVLLNYDVLTIYII